jgi:hypothetical protein
MSGTRREMGFEVRDEYPQGKGVWVNYAAGLIPWFRRK